MDLGIFETLSATTPPAHKDVNPFFVHLDEFLNLGPFSPAMAESDAFVQVEQPQWPREEREFHLAHHEDSKESRHSGAVDGENSLKYEEFLDFLMDVRESSPRNNVDCFQQPELFNEFPDASFDVVQHPNTHFSSSTLLGTNTTPSPDEQGIDFRSLTDAVDGNSPNAAHIPPATAHAQPDGLPLDLSPVMAKSAPSSNAVQYSAQCPPGCECLLCLLCLPPTRSEENGSEAEGGARASKLPRLSSYSPPSPQPSIFPTEIQFPLALLDSSSSKSIPLKNPIASLTSCDQSSRPPDMSARLAEIVGPLTASKRANKDSLLGYSSVSSLAFAPSPSPTPLLRSSSSLSGELGSKKWAPANARDSTLSNKTRTRSMAPLPTTVPHSSAHSIPQQTSGSRVDSSRDRQREPPPFPPVTPDKLEEALLQLAEAYATDNGECVEYLTKELQRFVNSRGNPIQRLLPHFMNALRSRHLGDVPYRKAIPFPQNEELPQILDKLMDNLPLLQFCWETSSAAIIRALRDDVNVHVLEIGLWRTTNWEPLVKHLGSVSSESHLRITAVEVPCDAEFPVRGPCDLPQSVIIEKLTSLGAKYGVSIEFTRLVTRLENLRRGMLDLRDEEAFVVCCTLDFHQLPDASVVRSNPRNSVLSFLRDLHPRVLTISEMDVDLNGPFFLARFRECLNFFHNVFESMDESIPELTWERLIFENHICPYDILNIVACEGLKRVIRSENLDKWQKRLSGLGFINQPSSDLLSSLDAKAKTLGEKFAVCEWNGDLRFTWKGQPILFCSNWYTHPTPVLRKRPSTINNFLELCA